MHQTEHKNSWKTAFGICLALLLLTVVVGSYIILDQGTALTYLRETNKDTEDDLDSVVELINETDLTKEEIKDHLQSHRLQEYMDFESNEISLERVQLIFKDDQLEKILIQ